MAVDERFIEDGFDLSCDVFDAGTLACSIDDLLGVIDSGIIGFVFYDEIEEQISALPFILVDADDLDCVVLNTSSFHPSVYTGFNFNSMTVFQDVLYAADSSGIYVFDSDTDDGTEFHTGVVLPRTNFLSMSDKRLRCVFVDHTGGPVSVSISSDKFGVAVATEVRELSRSKAFFSRNLRGKGFDIAISDFNVLSLVELFCVTLVR